MKVLAWIGVLVLASCASINPTQVDLTHFATLAPNEEPLYATDFTLLDLNGEAHQLSQQQGSWVVINFWQTTCAPCVEEMPALQAIDERYNNLEVWAINIRETPDQIRAFMQAHQLTLTVLLGSDQVSLDYTVMALPQTVVVAPNGEIVYRQFGALQLETFIKLLG